jgi:hypothetical protein
MIVSKQSQDGTEFHPEMYYIFLYYISAYIQYNGDISFENYKY